MPTVREVDIENAVGTPASRREIRERAQPANPTRWLKNREPLQDATEACQAPNPEQKKLQSKTPKSKEITSVENRKSHVRFKWH
jgi:hypothetical protein